MFSNCVKDTRCDQTYPYIVEVFFKTSLLVLWLRFLFYTQINARVIIIIIIIIIIMSEYVWNLILVCYISLTCHVVWLLCQLRRKEVWMSFTVSVVEETRSSFSAEF